MSTNSYHKLFCLILILILLLLFFLVIKSGIADLRYLAGKYYFEAATQSVDEQSKQDFLNRAFHSTQKALALDASNSSYYLQSARIHFHLDRLSSSNLKSRFFYEKGKMNLIKGLENSPIRADLWTEYAKALYENEGASKVALAVLDKALEFGPKESVTLFVNAFFTLYSWEQLDSQRQHKSWMLMLESMDDIHLARKINQMARQTGLERQLQRSLRER